MFQAIGKLFRFSGRIIDQADTLLDMSEDMLAIGKAKTSLMRIEAQLENEEIIEQKRHALELARAERARTVEVKATTVTTS